MAAECLDWRTVVQPLDDFDPAPTVEAMQEMLDAAVRKYREDLEELHAKGLVIVGFSRRMG